jgi:hypothetical protein
MVQGTLRVEFGSLHCAWVKQDHGSASRNEATWMQMATC